MRPATCLKPSHAAAFSPNTSGGAAIGRQRTRFVTQALFGKDNDKQDAARKALQDALKGKKDPFAAAEERALKRSGGSGGGKGGSGGGSDKGGGGGGDGGGFGGGFDFSGWGDAFRKGAGSLFQTVGTILLFGAALGALTLWKPLITLVTTMVRMTLRLDANPRGHKQPTAQVDLSKTDGLGNVEEAVIGKYAAAAEGEESEESEEEE